VSIYTARICKNGHVLTTSVEEEPDASNYCKKCGGKAIDNCQNCGKRIPGILTFWANTFKRPEFCHNCGEPYPWAHKTTDVVETTQAKWIKWTSPFYWFLVIKNKSLKAFIRLRKHHWTILEILTVILVLLALVTLFILWLRS